MTMTKKEKIAAVIAAQRGTRVPLGATYSTEKENFGEITNTFDVPVDWQGFRYHGYCWAPTKPSPVEG